MGHRPIERDFAEAIDVDTASRLCIKCCGDLKENLIRYMTSQSRKVDIYPIIVKGIRIFSIYKFHYIGCGTLITTIVITKEGMRVIDKLFTNPHRTTLLLKSYFLENIPRGEKLRMAISSIASIFTVYTEFLDVCDDVSLAQYTISIHPLKYKYEKRIKQALSNHTQKNTLKHMIRSL